MSRELLLQAAGGSSYYHDMDNNNNNGGGGDQGGGSSAQQALSDISSSQSQGSFGYDEYQKPHPLDEVDKTTSNIIVDSINNNNFLHHRRSVSHGDIGFRPDSLINFKSGSSSSMSGSFMNNVGKGSLLSFDQHHHDSSFIWKGDIDSNNNNNIMMSCYGDHNSRLQATNSDPKSILDEINNYQQPGSSSYGNWLYSDSALVAAANKVPEIIATQPEKALLKRPYMGDQSGQTSKKQCTTAAKGSSSKPSNKPASSKDPQSIAAKNRRERISERLKILQELVPNGPKVDLVTMLEKAISYVKFLQLQVKVLATDEFWPAQGGKAPDIAQVKEAIDAILASQRERSSSSK